MTSADLIYLDEEEDEDILSIEEIKVKKEKSFLFRTYFILDI